MPGLPDLLEDVLGRPKCVEAELTERGVELYLASGRTIVVEITAPPVLIGIVPGGATLFAPRLAAVPPSALHVTTSIETLWTVGTTCQLLEQAWREGAVVFANNRSGDGPIAGAVELLFEAIVACAGCAGRAAD